MARTGRPRKPQHLKVLEGTARPDRAPGSLSTELPPGAPAEPNWTKLFPGRQTVARKEAREAWLEVVPDLDRVGLLSHVDRGVLTAYCVATARWRECERALSRDGLTITQTITRKDGSTYKQTIRNPLQLTANDYSARLDRYRPLLGLDPMSRERLNVPSGTGTSDDDDEAEVFGR